MIDADIKARGVEEVRSEQNAATRLNNAIINLCWDRLDANEISPRELVERMKYRIGTCEEISHAASNYEHTFQTFGPSILIGG